MMHSEVVTALTNDGIVAAKRAARRHRTVRHNGGDIVADAVEHRRVDKHAAVYVLNTGLVDVPLEQVRRSASTDSGGDGTVAGAVGLNEPV